MTCDEVDMNGDTMYHENDVTVSHVTDEQDRGKGRESTRKREDQHRRQNERRMPIKYVTL